MAKSGKVAIVTGSATGLGAECAVDLAGRGWNLVINYTKSKKEADETFAAVKAKGAEAILVQADVGQDADCKKLVDETMKKWGRIDGLINNAGTTKFQNQGDLDGVSAGGFRPHPAGQRHRSLHDEPRRLSGDEEAVGGQAGAQLDREHLLDRRRHGRRQLDPLCLLQGRAQHADAHPGALVRRRPCGSTRCARASSRRAGCWAAWARRTTTR